MTPAASGDVTALLVHLKAGDRETRSQLMELIYPELRKLAHRQFHQERSGHLLQPTAVVHEAYLRLVAHDAHNWANRAHFFSAAAHIMRRILVDYARAHNAHKRNDGRDTVPLDDVDVVTHGPDVDLIALDEALDALEQLSSRQSQIVQLRYFAGLSVREVAEALSITPRTADRDWAAARAWLRLRLTP